jgi:hypothetical protein
MFEKYNKVQKAVLETTLRIINEKELQATSMSLIAKESGVSTGSIYHYFNSKEDIINELYKGIVRYNGEAVLKGFNDQDTIQQKFHLAWENFIHVSMKYPQGFQFIEQYSFSPYIYQTSKDEANKGGWCGAMYQLYGEAIEKQIFIELEPRMMVQMHNGSMVYLVKGHVQNYVNLTEDVIQRVIQSCWNSVCKEKWVE